MAEPPLIPDFVLRALRCPRTHSALRLAAAEELASLNAAIESGRICNVSGQPVDERLDGALLNQDQSLAYPIRFAIPVMLAEEAIALTQRDDRTTDVERAE